MVNTVRGTGTNGNYTIGLVISRFNERITEGLEDGALRALDEFNVPSENITAYSVPGAFEIPGTVRQVINNASTDGVVSLGAVIRGETPHFDYVSKAVTDGVARIACESEVPVTFGVITTDTREQAAERSGLDEQNKGYESACALIEMIDLYDKIT
ncbi:MAG: 6,7-dimethyl-8-ribityllumazine synthase [bacterium]